MQREKLERFGNVTKEKGLANVIVQGKMKRNAEKLFVDGLVRNHQQKLGRKISGSSCSSMERLHSASHYDLESQKKEKKFIIVQKTVIKPIKYRSSRRPCQCFIN